MLELEVQNVAQKDAARRLVICCTSGFSGELSVRSKQEVGLTLPNTISVDFEHIRTLLSNRRGIYFWFDINNGSITYIGMAVGLGGLKKRIIQQHLNPQVS